MWYFPKDLTEEYKHRRRELLDYYGLVAQLSALLPLLVIVAIRLANRATSQQTKRSTSPGSPYLKANRSQDSATFHLATSWRAFNWWSGTPISILSYPLGTNGQLLAGISWTAWLFVLCAVQTSEDYMHLTKRFGIVAVSQLPLHYLLSWKSAWSPVALLSGSSWEELNRIHQVLGRIITLFLVLHASFYLNYFILEGVLSKAVVRPVVILGLLMIISFLLLGSTALSAVREKNYRLFFLVHICVASFVLPALWFHVSHARIYVLETLTVVIVGRVLRFLSRKTATAMFTEIGPEMLEVSIPKSQLRRSWREGQHVYLSPASSYLLANPFTIASAPSEDRLRLVMRVLTGNTASLARKPAQGDRTVALEGPYGHTDHVARLARADRVLFLAGGVGGTFIVPLYRAVKERQNVKLVWAVRSAAETAWAQLGKDGGKKVYVTGTAGERRGGNVEMQGLLAGNEEGEALKGRPDIRRAVDEVFAAVKGCVAVYVCGPKGMGKKVREAVGRYVAEGREVVFWKEEFGLS